MKTYFHKTPTWLKKLYPSLIWNFKSDKKKVWLTFDDGPTDKLTQWILDCLDQFNARATFFCVGENLIKHPNLTNQMVEKGHVVANHSHNHLNGWKTDVESYVENVNKCQLHLPVKNNLYRPPYGKITRNQIKQLKALKKDIIMWDVLSGDFDLNLSPEACFEASVRYTSPGSIIVFHDNIKAENRLKFTLPRYLEYLSMKNYTFEVCGNT